MANGETSPKGERRVPEGLMVINKLAINNELLAISF